MSRTLRGREVLVETDDGVRLSVSVQGTTGPLWILLHGFPDRGRVWSRVVERLLPGQRVAAPDGRGVNLSGKPAGVEAYRLERLAADVLAVAEALAPGEPFRLAGHDWGGVTAWAVASLRPERVERLLVCNAPHPAVLADALTNDAEQRAASSYIDALRAPDAEARLERDRFAPLRAVFDGLRSAGVITAEDDEEAVEVWSRPGALAGALNWYRAAEFARPGGRSPVPARRLDLPVVLLWGEDDRALPPRLAEPHRAFCSDLEIRVLPGVGHWPLLERPDLVADVLSSY